MSNSVPITTQTWKSVVRVFAVAMERGPDRGQTITTVLMD